MAILQRFADAPFLSIPGAESDGIGHVRRSFMRRWAVSAVERMARKVTIPPFWGKVGDFVVASLFVRCE